MKGSRESGQDDSRALLYRKRRVLIRFLVEIEEIKRYRGPEKDEGTCSRGQCKTWRVDCTGVDRRLKTTNV